MKRHSSAWMTTSFFVFGLGFYACSVSTPSTGSSLNGEGAVLPDGSIFTRDALLNAFGACIVSEIESFEVQSRAFAQAANAAAGAQGPNASADVQAAWESTIDIWQRLELMQVGPAGRSTHPGGQDLRDEIYPWPQRDHCEIDQNLANELYEANADDVSSEAQGLWAAEYLLFPTMGDNACEADDEINTSGAWDALDEATLTDRRANYTALIANTVAEKAASLLYAWVPAGDDFLAQLTEAGDGSRTYGNQRVAINAVSDAFGYVEWGIKENKLSRPLGIPGCDQSDCTDYLEARFSRRSKEHLRNNMLGFRKLFKGCGPENEGLGFDDYLYAMGAPSLAENIDRRALAALDALDAIEEPDLVTALENDVESVAAVREAITMLSSLLRNEFLVALRLELPQMVQGDND